MATFPGLAIMIAVLALNILGEALNDALNIHSRNM
jgi:peptide/nickel transport system permease protein